MTSKDLKASLKLTDVSAHVYSAVRKTLTKQDVYNRTTKRKQQLTQKQQCCMSDFCERVQTHAHYGGIGQLFCCLIKIRLNLFDIWLEKGTASSWKHHPNQKVRWEESRFGPSWLHHGCLLPIVEGKIIIQINRSKSGKTKSTSWIGQGRAQTLTQHCRNS